MNTSLIVNCNKNDVSVALLEDGSLVEFHKDDIDRDFVYGDFYFCKVKKLSSPLNAAFIDIGHERDAFLHYLDLGKKVLSLNKFTKQSVMGKINSSELKDFTFEKNILKYGKISDVLKVGQDILVQVSKEPISTKGPRITMDLSLPGRFIVLVPFSNRISVSQKIKDEAERERLYRLIYSIRKENFGVVIRTVASNRTVEELNRDLEYLHKKWNLAIKKLRKHKPPYRVHSEINRAASILRETFNSSFNSIVVNEKKLYEECRDYIRLIDPNKSKIVEQHISTVPIFEKYNVDRQLRSSFGKIVRLSNGAYLIIEHTEAMHVIDVNSGQKAHSGESQEDNALKVNIIAATEIARQLRLRDMGGIIVIDFIDLADAANRKVLFKHFSEVMKGDKARHKILPPSKFGLIEMTRQRVRAEININTTEKIDQNINSSFDLIGNIENKLNKIINNGKKKTMVIHVHPFVGAYINKGFFSIRLKWIIRYKVFIKIQYRHSYNLLSYNFFDTKNNKISI